MTKCNIVSILESRTSRTVSFHHFIFTTDNRKCLGGQTKHGEHENYRMKITQEQHLQHGPIYQIVEAYEKCFDMFSKQ